MRLMIRKGLMTRDAFFRVYHHLKRRFPESPFVFHFRWATDGGIQPGLCHPFPIDRRRRILMARQPSNVKIAVAHNGVIPKWSGLGGDVSDTLLYVQNDLAPAFEADSTFLRNPSNRKQMAIETASRWAFLTNHGQLCAVGPFYRYDDLYYSKPLR